MILLMTLLPVNLFAEVVTGTAGDCTWELDTETGELTVSGVGQMGRGFDSYKNQILNVTIEVGVTSIGDWAFSDCSSLTSITIPEDVTSIGSFAFNKCSSLTTINIPDGVTSIGRSAFSGCSSLTTINIPDGVTSIEGYTFSGCSSLTSVTIPESVTSIGSYAFSLCSSLSKIVIPNIQSWCTISFGDDKSNPMNVGPSKHIYSDETTEITELVIPEGVTTIPDCAFLNCSSLTSVTIPEGVTSIGGSAFSGCSSLTSVTIPDGVTSIGGSAFSGCSSLTSVTIPDGVTSIENSAFWGCSSLTSVTIPDGVTSIGRSAFFGCSSLTSVTIPDGVTSIGGYAFSGCSRLTSVTIPDGVTSIGESAFSGCIRLTSVTIPEGVTSIGGDAFNRCSNLIYFTFDNPTPISLFSFPTTPLILVPDASVAAYQAAWPDYQNNIIGKSDDVLKTVEVSAKSSSSDLAEKIGENNLLKVTKLKLSGTINSYDMMIIRNKMINLRELDLEDVDIVANNYEYYTGFHSEDSVFGGRFLYKSNVTSVVLPKSIKTIGKYAFSESKLNNIVFTGNKLRTIEAAAFQTTNIVNVTLPEGVETLSWASFDHCRNMKSITLPQSLNNLYGIGDYSFYTGAIFNDCPCLTEIIVPENIISLPGRTFDGCTSLTDIKLSPRTQTIEGGAFNKCQSLTSFKLPPYLQTIGDGAFSGCSNLKDIYAYMVDVPAISTNTFNDYQHQNLYVPEFLYNSYFYDTNWSQFLTVNVCDLKPGDYEAFYANSDVYFEPGVERITEDTPEVELGEHGGIIVEGEEQHFGDVHQNADGDGDSSSLIADGDDDGSNNNMPINKLFVDMKVKANRWYFFCFPFDVTISECSYPGKYVWRHYDGAIRALQGSGGWQPVEGDKLEARHGYIFQSSEKGTLTVKFDHPTFGGERPKELVPHASNNAANASWNFVGNPYSSYYDFLEEDFTAPITVWNGSSYVAYRPGDDEYHLQPYEAFFVQKPEAQDEINFEPERRETYWQIQKKKVNGAKARQAKGINPDRLILNLTVGAAEGGHADRMRLVLNEQASRSYELECDAAKFLSNDAAAQIYTVEGENSLAINERPMDGDIRIGYVAKSAGTLRISAPRMDLPMLLVDTETGTSFDLSLGDYEFQTNAGTNNQRFLLKPSGETTAIRTLTKDTGVAVGLQEGGLSIGGAEGKTVTVHTTAGALAAQHSGNGFVSLPGGMYVVSVDGKSAKIYVK